MVDFKNNIISGINIFCLGIMFKFFLVYLNVVDYNYLVGLGEVSELAAQISTENNINTIATYKMGRSENMDVYLNRDIVKLHESQELDDPLMIAKPYVLITKEKEFMKIEKYAVAYENTVMKRSGRYIVLIME